MERNIATYALPNIPVLLNIIYPIYENLISSNKVAVLIVINGLHINYKNVMNCCFFIHYSFYYEKLAYLLSLANPKQCNNLS